MPAIMTDATARNAKPKAKKYRLAVGDGSGLYLEIHPNNAKYWRQKYYFAGKEKVASHGVYPEVTLKEARETAAGTRKLLSGGTDPVVARKVAKVVLVETTKCTVANLFDLWKEDNAPHVTEKHIYDTAKILENHVMPAIGKMPARMITPDHILAIVNAAKTKSGAFTANRIRQILGQVFRFGVTQRKVDADPTRDLVRSVRVPKRKGYKALTTPATLAPLLKAIEGYTGSPSLYYSLKLAPHLFVRPSELRTMEWSEINWKESRWELPAEKMKMRQPHIVPLSRQVLAMLEELKKISGGDRYVLPSPQGKKNRPVSNTSFRYALDTIGFMDQMTGHGFRATARTILDEVLGYRPDWIEHQLAHSVKDPNGNAYNRTTHIDGRAKMMQHWSDFLDATRAQAS